ncbi:hypothetical protein [Paraburkholderia sp.]|nr:hypothetical protein [Paraburkholderia sp.]HZZ05347.1 hypothetical protein [Paraburkholderia sp.]
MSHVFSADITVYHAIYDAGRSATPTHLIERELAALTSRVPLAKPLHVGH